MTKLTFKKLFTVMLLSGSCCLVTAQNKEKVTETNHLAPEATLAEAELSFRDIQPLDKAFIEVAPSGRKDELAVGQLSDDGRNKDQDQPTHLFSAAEGKEHRNSIKFRSG